MTTAPKPAVQAPLPLKCDRCITPERASQIMMSALGHGFSRTQILRLLDEGRLRGHQLKPRSRWWVETESVYELIQTILPEPSK